MRAKAKLVSAAPEPKTPASSASVAPSTSPSIPPEDVEVDIQARAVEARALFVELCREDVKAFCEFVIRDEETGQSIEQLDFHVRIQEALTEHRRIVVLAHPESGKRLAVTTEIPTPAGW